MHASVRIGRIGTIRMSLMVVVCCWDAARLASEDTAPDECAVVADAQVRETSRLLMDGDGRKGRIDGGPADEHVCQSGQRSAVRSILAVNAL